MVLLSDLRGTKKVISENKQALFNSPRQVTLGNPNGDVTMVEFFDYNCGFCKRALDDIEFKRINYVEEVQRKVYERMIAERERIAREEAEIAAEKERIEKEKAAAGIIPAQVEPGEHEVTFTFSPTELRESEATIVAQATRCPSA